MTPTETAAQLRLAADILETGHPWEGQGSSGWAKMEILSPVAILYAGHRIRPILARPPYEAELHNPDNLTAEQVGVGWRLITSSEIDGEQNPNTQFWSHTGEGWKRIAFAEKCHHKDYTYRLSLSVPWPEQPDPYAELKKAHADGKVIECITGTDRRWMAMQGEPRWFLPVEDYRIKPDEIPWIEWRGGPCPLKDEEVEEWQLEYRVGGVVFHPNIPSEYRWKHLLSDGDIVAYRVLKWREKKPKVPLGPEDVPPCCAFRRQNESSDYIMPTSVYVGGIYGHDEIVFRHTWEYLKEHYQVNRSIPMTGKWNPDAWEACSKQIDA